MYLYGHNLQEWRDTKRPGLSPLWEVLKIHGIAVKYDVPELVAEILAYVRSLLFSTSMVGLELSPSGRGWIWNLAEKLYCGTYDIEEIRADVVTALRSCSKYLVSRDPELVRNALLACPGLAIDLTMSRLSIDRRI